MYMKELQTEKAILKFLDGYLFIHIGFSTLFYRLKKVLN